MNSIHKACAPNLAHLGLVFFTFFMAFMMALGALAQKKSRPADVPATVIAHLPLPAAPGNQMALQKEGGARYLYIQQASKQGYMVVDVTKPERPAIVKRGLAPNQAAAGQLDLVGPEVGLASVPTKGTEPVTRKTENSTETVRVLDLSDPSHPRTIQTFEGVTSTLPEAGRALVYLTNNDGLWILRYREEQLTPERKKRPCDSEAAISAMPPDCE